MTARRARLQRRLERHTLQLDQFLADSSTNRQQLESLARRIRRVRRELAELDHPALLAEERRCRVCGCTEGDCTGCVIKTGAPCHWVATDLCSACV